MDFSPIKEDDNCNSFVITSSDGQIKNENSEMDHSDNNFLTMLDTIKAESPDPLMIENDTINIDPKDVEPDFKCELVIDDAVNNAKETLEQLEPTNISSNLKQQYSCLHCPMTFTSKKVLQKHNSVHEEKCEKFQCDLCGRLFQHNSNLICHKKIHMAVDGNFPNRKREFTNDERNVILQFLLDRKINGKLPKGSLGEAAKKFTCNRMTISTIWKRACKGFASGNTCPSVDSLKKHSGRKRIDYSDKLAELSKITQNESVSLKSMSLTLSIPKTTLYNIYRRGEIKRESSHFKSNLSEENRRERSEFYFSNFLQNGNFEELYNRVHVDEKCYYLTKLNKSYYLSLDEEGPRISSERNFVTKVVIIAAVARPRCYDANNLFDGKIGIWTFVSQELVKRERSIRSESKLRFAMKKKHIKSVNRDDIRKSVLKKLYHAIYEKWPNESRTLPIYVQLDESKSHLSPFDASVVEEGLRDGWNISLKSQPPNSSDFNAVDRGFFNSLQPLESKSYWKTIEDLVSEIEKTFNDEASNVLENGFMCLRKAMECSFKDNGSNNFNLEEMKVKFEQTPNLDVMQIDTTVTSINARGKREFTNDERNAILQFLLDRKINGKLSKGSLALAAQKFECNRATVSRIWKRACEGFANGDTCPRVDSLKKQCGRKRIDYSDKLSKIPHNESVSLKTLSRSLSIPKTTLYNIYRRGDIKRESDDVLPALTEENTRERFEFCTSKLLPNQLLEELYDYVHVDEKCYYLTKLNKSYYLSLDGKSPQILSERNYVTKVVIIAAVARPRYDDTKTNLFDGKIGIWPFVSQEIVQRNRSIRSERKMKGKMKNKHFESMNTDDDIRITVLQSLCNAICEKWPSELKTMPIYVQLDESKPHLRIFNANITEQGLKNGCNIQLKPQPTNSPDFNSLHQGFFNTMQSIESKKYWKSVDELVNEIERAFNLEFPDFIDNAFSTVRTAMENSLLASHSNNYNLQEMDAALISPHYEFL